MAKRVIDYAFKSYVLREHNDLILKARKSTQIDYAISELECNGVILPVLSVENKEHMTLSQLYEFCSSNGLLREFYECLKINTASYKRTKRLKERIENKKADKKICFTILNLSYFIF